MDALDKVTRINMLIDVYAPLLTDKQRAVLLYYYQDNYSLGEISDLVKTSRQAVFEHIKRAEQSLEDVEDKLGLLRKDESRRDTLQAMEHLLQDKHPETMALLAPYFRKLEQS
ncbi:YlxM family DNA-binding protein [Marinicrinis sediminis]|uniref:UPF0122 protein ACFSUC_00795 n=1 Tax=Marinicrinis sediminis TaxID=1652465 RepID=A0ABW5R5B9_9BACL